MEGKMCLKIWPSLVKIDMTQEIKFMQGNNTITFFD